MSSTQNGSVRLPLVSSTGRSHSFCIKNMDFFCLSALDKSLQLYALSSYQYVCHSFLLLSILPVQEEIFVSRAPGRLDVMGGIADYSGSLVLQVGSFCFLKYIKFSLFSPWLLSFICHLLLKMLNLMRKAAQRSSRI